MLAPTEVGDRPLRGKNRKILLIRFVFTGKATKVSLGPKAREGTCVAFFF